MPSYKFAEHLGKFGPQSQNQVISLDEAFRYCRELANSHYENFSVLSLLLPKYLRQHFANVYAYCRWSDDLGDEELGQSFLGAISSSSDNGSAASDPTVRTKLFEWWRDGLVGVYDQVPTNNGFRWSSPHPVMLALKETVRQFGIPQQPFADLVTAFERDQHQTRYDSWSDLLSYCEKSANPVGRIVLHLGKSATAENCTLSDRICTGLQLANFWQDVARDFAIGRIYIPTEGQRKFGIVEADFRNPQSSEEFKQLIQFEVERAEQLFVEGLPLIESVKPAIRNSVELFVRGGLEILKAIRSQDHDVLRSRPRLSRWQKMKLILLTMSPGRLDKSRTVKKTKATAVREGMQ